MLEVRRGNKEKGMTDKEQLDKLKAFILCEADNLAAWAWISDSNELGILWGMWFSLNDILPELKEYAEEAIYVLEKAGKKGSIPQGWYWQENQDRLAELDSGMSKKHK